MAYDVDFVDRREFLAISKLVQSWADEQEKITNLRGTAFAHQDADKFQYWYDQGHQVSISWAKYLQYYLGYAYGKGRTATLDVTFILKPWFAIGQDFSHLPDLNPWGFAMTVQPGEVYWVLGEGKPGLSEGRGSRLDHPAGMSEDKAGRLYVADSLNHRVVMSTDLYTENTITTTVAGTGSPSYLAECRVAAKCSLNLPFDVLSDRNGSLFIADSGNHVIREVRGLVQDIPCPGSQTWHQKIAKPTTEDFDDLLLWRRCQEMSVRIVALWTIKECKRMRETGAGSKEKDFLEFMCAELKLESVSTGETNEAGEPVPAPAPNPQIAALRTKLVAKHPNCTGCSSDMCKEDYFKNESTAFWKDNVCDIALYSVEDAKKQKLESAECVAACASFGLACATIAETQLPNECKAAAGPVLPWNETGTPCLTQHLSDYALDMFMEAFSQMDQFASSESSTKFWNRTYMHAWDDTSDNVEVLPADMMKVVIEAPNRTYQIDQIARMRNTICAPGTYFSHGMIRTLLFQWYMSIRQDCSGSDPQSVGGRAYNQVSLLPQFLMEPIPDSGSSIVESPCMPRSDLLNPIRMMSQRTLTQILPNIAPLCGFNGVVCELGEGHCEVHADCKAGLRCGFRNCPFFVFPSTGADLQMTPGNCCMKVNSAAHISTHSHTVASWGVKTITRSYERSVEWELVQEALRQKGDDDDGGSSM
eukprot:gnl/TRDRNA2_/TRDRNA2_153676_c1_seq1.p1 gnl/TRDRNA2_/TRDRNA2_153676_c1~~gnl/TRDRNA2_/TRDRNA2_153676_c1_seq1.p1  ORF type:complete len:703 (+),score=97.61 gnl/TRDRNA2_/TRDRNA2_153676_c1_seq1:1-2109(+)